MFYPEFFKEIYRYRYVVYNYVWSSLKQKYRRSVLGFVWSVIAPLMQNLIIGVVFFYLMRFDMPNYIVYLFSGTIIFNLMSNVIIFAPNIMINNENFIKKIYVPKLAFILQVVFFEVVNFFLIVVSLVILAAFFDKLQPSWVYLILPFPILLIILFLIGLASILSVMTVYFRDMFHIVPVVMQAAFFLTPVLYPMSYVPQKLQNIIAWNPFYYFVELFRGIVLLNVVPVISTWLICTTLSISTFIIGIVILKVNDNKIVYKL